MPIAPPVPYSPAVETPEADEADVIDQLNGTLRSIIDTTHRDYGRAVRALHAKSHGIVRGILTVAPDLPPDLAQGLFAQPGRYDAILRVSTAPGDILDDAVSAPRGLGLKLFDVPGDPLPGSPPGEQDFLMVNGPVFGAPTPKAFLGNLKMLAATTDKAEGLKKVISATLRAMEGALEAVGGQSVLISQLGGTPETHPLGDTYYSQTAFRYGAFIAKFSLRPVSAALRELEGTKVAVAGRPDALREDVREVIAEQGGVWELCVQLCRDLEAMPVEDPTVLWDEERSPFVAVARLEAPPQITWANGVSDLQENALSYSAWHGLAAHQPLGAINRARKPVYEAAAGRRSELNACPFHSAAVLEELDA